MYEFIVCLDNDGNIWDENWSWKTKVYVMKRVCFERYLNNEMQYFFGKSSALKNLIKWSWKYLFYLLVNEHRILRSSVPIFVF